MVIQSFLLGNKSFFLLTTVERMKKKHGNTCSVAWNDTFVW